MRSWKTTVSGIIYVIGVCMKKTPSPALQVWSEAVEAAGVMLLAMAARDNNVTSEQAGIVKPTEQTKP